LSHTARKLSLCSSTKNITSRERNKDGKRKKKTRRETEEELRKESVKKLKGISNLDLKRVKTRIYG
jgi:hypothetical protein